MYVAFFNDCVAISYSSQQEMHDVPKFRSQIYRRTAHIAGRQFLLVKIDLIN